jgi:hypothetical protein
MEGSFAGENLDGNVTFELRIVRSINLAHAADAEKRKNLILANSPAGPGLETGARRFGELVRNLS